MDELTQIVERIIAARAVVHTLEAEQLRIAAGLFGPGDGLAQAGWRGDE